MPRVVAVNNKRFPMAAKVALSLMLAPLMSLTWSTTLQTQGPAHTTISDGAAVANGVTLSKGAIEFLDGCLAPR